MQNGCASLQKQRLILGSLGVLLFSLLFSVHPVSALEVLIDTPNGSVAVGELNANEEIGSEEIFLHSQEMRLYDQQVAEALSEADRLTAIALAKDPLATPILPVLPKLAVQKNGLRLDPSFFNNDMQLDPVESGRAACGENCYQTDFTKISQGLPSGSYAFDYYLWIGNPQSNETNRCDGSSGPICFWFQSTQYNMDAVGAGFHVGPQRGISLFGDSGDDWHLSHSGYNAPNSGNPIGAVCVSNASAFCVNGQEIPMGTWVRVRVWRLSTVSLPYAGWFSKWGSWAMWNGADHQIGTNLWLRGQWLVWANQFVEIYETDDQCSTDFERTYFNSPSSLSTSQGWTLQPHANAGYQNQCGDTTWEGWGSTFIRNEREHLRLIAEDDALW